MRSANPSRSSAYFLGVRLSSDEVEQIDRFQKTLGAPSRSEAVRALLHRTEATRGEGTEIPVSLRAELDELVEDGWVRTHDEAVTLVVTLGLQELSRLHGERVPALRRAARDAAGRGDRRRRADREGRGLLGG